MLLGKSESGLFSQATTAPPLSRVKVCCFTLHSWALTPQVINMLCVRAGEVNEPINRSKWMLISGWGGGGSPPAHTNPSVSTDRESLKSTLRTTNVIIQYRLSYYVIIWAINRPQMLFYSSGSQRGFHGLFSCVSFWVRCSEPPRSFRGGWHLSISHPL